RHMKEQAVLIVDDDPDFRDMVRMVVEPMGAQVFEASTCCQALELLSRERKRIRLVLLDYFMPGMQPSECARKLSELATPEATILLCTAAVNPAGRAAEVGLSRWLGKPFSITQLEHVIEEAGLRFEDQAAFGLAQ